MINLYAGSVKVAQVKLSFTLQEQNGINLNKLLRIEDVTLSNEKKIIDYCRKDRHANNDI